MGAGNNLVSLESGKLFFNYFTPSFEGKRVVILENLVDRSKYDTFFPKYFKSVKEVTLIHTHRSLLKDKQLNDLFNGLEQTHSVSMAVPNIDPYFKVFKIVLKKE